MKKTIKYLMLTLVAVFACVAISSCNKTDDDDPNKGIGNYYVQLTGVETNCIDATGNNLADIFKSGWITENKADSQGKKTIMKQHVRGLISILMPWFKMQMRSSAVKISFPKMAMYVIISV